MNKTKINAIVNIFSFFFLLPSAVSGFVLLLVLPSNQGAGFGRGYLDSPSFWLGLERHSWVKMHNLTSVIFVLLMVIHLFLHLPWIKNINNCFRSSVNKNK